MKMSKIEKWFMNRPQHAEQAINRAEKLLHFVNVREEGHTIEPGKDKKPPKVKDFEKALVEV